MSDDRKREVMPHRDDTSVPAAGAKEAANHLGQDDAGTDEADKRGDEENRSPGDEGHAGSDAGSGPPDSSGRGA